MIQLTLKPKFTHTVSIGQVGKMNDVEWDRERYLALKSLVKR